MHVEHSDDELLITSTDETCEEYATGTFEDVEAHGITLCFGIRSTAQPPANDPRTHLRLHTKIFMSPSQAYAYYEQLGRVLDHYEITYGSIPKVSDTIEEPSA